MMGSNMVKFKNIKFEKGNPETGLFCYADMLQVAVNRPAPGKSFTPKENFERTELYKKLEAIKGDIDKEVQLEDAEFKGVMLAYDVMQLTGRNDEAAEMYAYFKEIRS